jgi:hypothetical protein
MYEPGSGHANDDDSVREFMINDVAPLSDILERRRWEIVACSEEFP